MSDDVVGKVTSASIAPSIRSDKKATVGSGTVGPGKVEETISKKTIKNSHSRGDGSSDPYDPLSRGVCAVSRVT